MKIRIEFDFNEAVMFKEMIHTAVSMPQAAMP